MIDLKKYSNGSYSYYSERSKKHVNIPAELGIEIEKQQAKIKKVIGEAQKMLHDYALNPKTKYNKVAVDFAGAVIETISGPEKTPAAKFVTQINNEFPGTFPNPDSDKDITDYSSQNGGEVIVK